MERIIGKIFVVATALVAMMFTSCSDDGSGSQGPIIYYTDIVTCHLDADSLITFEQVLRDDNGSIVLQPQTALSNSGISEGQRILLQYMINSISPDSTLYNISVIQMGGVRSDDIIDAPADTIAAYPNDNVIINTLWRTGGYINFDLKLEYYSKQHRLDLFYNPAQTSTDTLDILLRHDKNGDASGYWTQAYASYYVPELLQNEYKALRVYASMPSEPIGYLIIKLRD